MEDKHFNRQLADDLALRIAKVRHEMRASEAQAALITSNPNIYYTSGRMFRGYVYIPAEGEVRYLVVRPQESDVPGVIAVRKPEQIPDVLAEAGISIPDVIGLELDNLTVSAYERLRKALGGVRAVNVSQLMRRARMTKTPYEIAAMREDGEHQTAAYRRISHLYRENMTDIELQIEIERCLRLEGCLGYTRMSGDLMEINMGSVLAGDNADAPGPYDFSMGGAGVDLSLPVGANGTVLRAGIAVMVDMNGNFNGYQTDLTRVWKVGDIDPRAMKAHEVSRAILHRLEKEAKAGFPISRMAEIAYEMADEAGLADYFMGHRQKAGFIGHGVGIELNEQPVIMTRNKDLLEENCTIALEPKFVIPGTGAVGNENTYLVTAQGLENLTPFNEEIMDL